MNSIGNFSNQQKSKSPSAASRGKPAQQNALSLAITVLQHLVIARRHDKAISFADSSMEIASADEKSASQ
jgi:hypothetical protein